VIAGVEARSGAVNNKDNMDQTEPTEAKHGLAALKAAVRALGEGDFELRGELMVSRAEFARLDVDSGAPGSQNVSRASSARHWVSGLARRRDRDTAGKTTSEDSRDATRPNHHSAPTPAQTPVATPALHVVAYGLHLSSDPLSFGLFSDKTNGADKVGVQGDAGGYFDLNDVLTISEPYSVLNPGRPHNSAAQAPLKGSESGSGSASLTSHWGRLQLLRELGFEVDSSAELVAGVEALGEGVARVAEARAQGALAYDSDGVVVKLDDLALAQQLGATSRHPRWAAAFKFPPQTAETLVENVSFHVGRTGRVTPVAHVRPTRLGGVVVSRVF
jgi:hypothetical protein